jgi:hypothetical protein
MEEAPAIVKEKMTEVAGCCEIAGDLDWTWSEDEDGSYRIHVRPAVVRTEGNPFPTYPNDIRWDLAALVSIFDEVKAIAWHPAGLVEAGLHVEAWDGAEFWISIYAEPDEPATATSGFTNAIPEFGPWDGKAIPRIY